VRPLAYYPTPCAHVLWVKQNLPCVTYMCAGGGLYCRHVSADEGILSPPPATFRTLRTLRTGYFKRSFRENHPGEPRPVAFDRLDASPFVYGVPHCDTARHSQKAQPEGAQLLLFPLWSETVDQIRGLCMCSLTTQITTIELD